MIDKSVVDGALKGQFTPKSSTAAEFGGIFDELDSIPPPNGESEVSVFPSLITSFPLSYLNKAGERIDICGEVATSTKEHEDGFLFFDHRGDVYRRDGTFSSPGSEHDLSHRLDSQSAFEVKAISKTVIWVNPKHQLSQAFFKKIDHIKRPITPGRHYLNRMGFVRDIQAIADNNTGQAILDSENFGYDHDGRRLSTQASMYDLVYEIVNWEMFQQVDWSQEELSTSFVEQESRPELFDPFLDDRNAMLEEFYRTILRTHSLAARLGIKYHLSMMSVENFS